MKRLNYQHLRYFYEVAKYGSVTEAAEQNFVSPQTISSQIQLLEERLGQPLFERRGRKLRLTTAGEFALGHAEKIFALGEQLTDALLSNPSEVRVPLNVGVTDSVPKLMASRVLLSLVAAEPNRELVVEEGATQDLLGKLVTQQLQAVLTDREPTIESNLAIHTQCLVTSDVVFMAAPDIVRGFDMDFPACLNQQPIILWSGNSSLNNSLSAWFRTAGLTPKVVARCSDSALMKSLATSGFGIIAVPEVIAPEIEQQHGLLAIGNAEGLTMSLWLAESTQNTPLAIQWQARES